MAQLKKINRLGLLRGLIQNAIFKDGRYGPRYYRNSKGKSRQLADRWADISLIVDLRPSDRVLDIGCAEGLLTCEIAKRVQSVHGVEMLRDRVKLARAEAIRKGLKNVTFEQGLATTYDIGIKSYDVIFLLSVLGHSDSSGRVDLETLKRVLAGASRQVYIRFNCNYRAERKGLTLSGILMAIDEMGFDGVAFSRTPTAGEVICANRRGTDAKLTVVPPLSLVPTAASNNPCLVGAKVGTYEDFAM